MKNTEFLINSLRTDKIIYAVEAVAFNIAAVVAVNLALYLRLPRIYIIAPPIIALTYTLFMAIGNLWRLSRIKKLEAV